ncbi:MAG: sulfatase-like hydrolase/transferase, partial [Planctomycetota bacterium]|nr:sulfatase-like hydrolase/transferase [Planctomycetota bacterium]
MTISTLMLAVASSAWLGSPVGLDAGEDSAASSPNILLVLVDDLGCRDLAGEGHDRHRTPALDELRSASVRFTNAATNAPNCAPSRAALVTGRHGTRTGVHTVGTAKRGKAEDRLVEPPTNRTVLEDSERTIAEILRDAGYRTGFVGKWHLGLDPTTDGFDENVAGGRPGHPKSYSPPYRNPALEDGPEGEYLVDRLGAETASMVSRFAEARETDGRPWFVMYAPYAVHTPIQAPEDAVARVKAEHPRLSDRAARYQVMVERTDAAIAAVLAEVDPANTIVCLASD